jgi:hypothetical protein
LKQLQKRDYLIGFSALIYGFFLFFNLLNNLLSRTSEVWRFFYQFTQQSNLLSSIWLILLGLSTFFHWEKIYTFVTKKIVIVAITVYISITFFIVLFILNPVFAGRWIPLANTYEFLFHNATTIVVWFFYFLIKGHGTLEYKQIPKVLLYPLFYVILNLIVGYSTTYLSGQAAFAYGFINPGSYGNNFFLYFLVLLVLLAIFTLFTFGLIAFKKRINHLYFDEFEKGFNK